MEVARARHRQANGAQRRNADRLYDPAPGLLERVVADGTALIENGSSACFRQASVDVVVLACSCAINKGHVSETEYLPEVGSQPSV